MNHDPIGRMAVNLSNLERDTDDYTLSYDLYRTVSATPSDHSFSGEGKSESVKRHCRFIHFSSSAWTLVEHPHLAPSFFLLSAAWFMIATETLRVQHPSPWHRCFSLKPISDHCDRDQAERRCHRGSERTGGERLGDCPTKGCDAARNFEHW
mgnify:FL=1